VQVENEAGTWGSVRDYSPTAEKLFEAPVPADVLQAMGQPGGTPGNWQEAFGPEAEVNFHAWAVATYVGKVAAAGKAVYPLPLYANAALRDPVKPDAPGSYEADGPTDNVIPIWKAAAPAINIVSPDIYMNDPVAYLKVLELYHRDDNALFIPETSGSAAVARFFFSALGLQAIGFSPFGLDYSNTPTVPAAAREPSPTGTAAGPATQRPQDQFAPTAQNYRLIGPMMREIARLNFEGNLQAIAEEAGTPSQTLLFGEWNATISYGGGRRGGRITVTKERTIFSTRLLLILKVVTSPIPRSAARTRHACLLHLNQEGNWAAEQRNPGEIPRRRIDASLGWWGRRFHLPIPEGSFRNNSRNPCGFSVRPPKNRRILPKMLFRLTHVEISPTWVIYPTRESP